MGNYVNYTGKKKQVVYIYILNNIGCSDSSKFFDYDKAGVGDANYCNEVPL